MRSDDALERLTELLRAAGVDLDHPSADDVDTTWRVMRQFAAEDVQDCAPREEGGDGILAQYGTWSGPFELDMTRQLTFADEDGEYDHMAQLNCTFAFEATERLAALEPENEWSFEMSLDEFFALALALPGFRTVHELQMAPLSLELGYGDV